MSSSANSFPCRVCGVFYSEESGATENFVCDNHEMCRCGKVAEYNLEHLWARTPLRKDGEYDYENRELISDTTDYESHFYCKKCAKEEGWEVEEEEADD